MVVRILKLLLPLLFFVLIFSWIFTVNPNPGTITYWSGQTWTAPMGILLTMVFCFGATVASCIALVLGAKQTFIAWRKERYYEKVRTQRELMEKGRECLASRQLSLARNCFRKIIDSEPGDIVARVMLAKVLEAEGKLEDALAVLDLARQSQRKNKELLLLAADFHEQLGNTTGAADNLNLVLELDRDHIVALERIGSCYERLGRLDQAISSQKQVVKLKSNNERKQAEQRLAQLELDLATKTYLEDQAGLLTAVEDILKVHQDFPPALRKAAQLKQARSEYQVAVRLLSREYQLTGDVQCLRELSAVWIGMNDPRSAVSTVRECVTKQQGERAVRGRLYLIELYFQLEMIDEAKKELDGVLATPTMQLEDKFRRCIYSAIVLQREGKEKQAFQSLLSLLDQSASSSLAQPVGRRVNGLADVVEQPSPMLSTP